MSLLNQPKIMGINIETVVTRPAVWEDADDLLGWKNDETVRRFSIVSKEPILRENHLRWLQKTLADPNVSLKVILSGDQKLGDIRFDTGEDHIEVSIRLDPRFRGMGVGSRVIAQECARMENQNSKTLTATIVDGNQASLRLFTKNGFKVIDQRNGVSYLHRVRTR